jgi:outer membrane assembly lipoprotein YfiO
MRRTLHCVFILATFFYSYGCGQKSAKLQKSVVQPDRTLFETGSDYLKKSQYIKSRLAFQTLLNTYPDSELAAEAYFAMGDSFYEEGGTENLLLAEGQYKNFLTFFPGHPRGAEAQMKTISLNYKMMHSPDRDQQYSYRTLQEIKRLIKQWPESDYVPIAKQFEREVEEVIARSNYLVGKFYADRGNYLGARDRFREIEEDYADYSGMDEVYFQSANAWDKSNNPEKATLYYSKIVAEYPFSKHSEEAKKSLNLLGKPEPPVDTQIAAANQSRAKKDEGLSLLQPFVDFGKSLGVVSQRDIYRETTKTIAAEKVKNAEAEAASIQVNAEPADDIQIETVIRKDASGATQDTTTVGSGSAAISQSNPDKTKSTNKSKKKKYNKKPS